MFFLQPSAAVLFGLRDLSLKLPKPRSSAATCRSLDSNRGRSIEAVAGLLSFKGRTLKSFGTWKDLIWATSKRINRQGHSTLGTIKDFGRPVEWGPTNRF